MTVTIVAFAERFVAEAADLGVVGISGQEQVALQRPRGLSARADRRASWPVAAEARCNAGELCYMIIQAIVLESELLVELIVNDPLPRAETHGVPTVPEGPTLVR